MTPQWVVTGRSVAGHWLVSERPQDGQWGTGGGGGIKWPPGGYSAHYWVITVADGWLLGMLAGYGVAFGLPALLASCRCRLDKARNLITLKLGWAVAGQLLGSLCGCWVAPGTTQGPATDDHPRGGGSLAGHWVVAG